MILDIHTHKGALQPEGVVSCRPGEFSPVKGQLYSVGIHPWDMAAGITLETWKQLEEALGNPQVVALGECGIDIPKGGALYKQMLALKKEIEMSESFGKPLIIHNVKAQEILIGIKKDMKPQQPWLIHGFRGKPTVAQMLTDAGMVLSFGERFNEATLAGLDKNLIFAETDESELTIEAIIARMSAARGEDLTDVIASNTRRFLRIPEMI